jgi:hypothetical protein
MDVSQVHKDLAKAKEEFRKFGSEIENQAGKHGEGAGAKLAEALGHKLTGSRHLAGALATGLGLNIEKISEGIAEAIVGGSKEGWKQSIEIAKENASLIEKIVELHLNPKQLQEKREKDLTKAIREADAAGKETHESTLHNILSRAIGGAAGKQFGSNVLAKFGFGDDDATKLQKTNEAQNKILEAQAVVEEDKKKTKEQLLEIDRQIEDSEEKQGTTTERAEKVGQRINKIWMELRNSNLTEVETAKKKLELHEKLNELGELAKKYQTEEQARAAVLLALDEKRFALGEKRLALTADENKIKDKSKLTIGELANIQGGATDDFAKAQEESEKRRKEAFSFGADVNLSPAQEAARDKAKQVQDLESQAEAARLAGNQDSAKSLTAQASGMRDDLVAGGFTKSTEGDPMKELREQIAKDNQAIKTILTEIKTIEAGRYVNTP